VFSSTILLREREREREREFDIEACYYD